MDVVPPLHPVMPVDRDWVIALDTEAGHVHGYDATTLDCIFSGYYFSPEEYKGRDPRGWTRRQLKYLVRRYGFYGGSEFDSAIFMLAEVTALHALLQTSTPDLRRHIAQVPLVDALAVARDAYSQFVLEHVQR
jgi:hypothetical protein